MRERIEVATKFGVIIREGKFGFEVRGDPAHVRAACEGSLKRLEIDCIDLYYQHRIDTRLPIEVTVCALQSLYSAFPLIRCKKKKYIYIYIYK